MLGAILSDSTGSIGSRQGVHIHSATIAVKPHMTVDQRENRVVLAQPDAFSRMKLRSALAYDDIPSHHRLTSELFDA